MKDTTSQILNSAKGAKVTGRSTRFRVTVALITVGAAISGGLLALDYVFRDQGLTLEDLLPVPRTLKTRAIETKQNPDLSNLYFWDYSAQLQPQVLNDFEIFVPYEKGPPQKYLARVQFRDRKTQSVAFEITGRKPREFLTETLIKPFNSDTLLSRFGIHSIERWAALAKIRKEASIPGSDLIRYGLTHLQYSTFSAFGTDWIDGTSRLLLINREGMAYTASCFSNPCPFSEFLETIAFSEQVRTRREDRLTAMRELLRKEFAALQSDPATVVTSRRRILLVVVSLLTIDPRSPELFFHLGKLTNNRETLESAIRYAKDLKLEKAKLIELESLRQKL